jgi:hypothetical protein
MVMPLFASGNFSLRHSLAILNACANDFTGSLKVPFALSFPLVAST